jgi:hypothetical protein
MTAQFSEWLSYKGEDHALFSNPLNDYFSQGAPIPPFDKSCSALWRGYVGRWKIEDDRLYLVSLGWQLQDGSPVTLQTVFPGASGPVFAEWYSGTLRLPKGKKIENVHMGYSSVYERDALIEIVKGDVVRTWVQENEEDLAEKTLMQLLWRMVGLS